MTIILAMSLRPKLIWCPSRHLRRSYAPSTVTSTSLASTGPASTTSTWIGVARSCLTAMTSHSRSAPIEIGGTSAGLYSLLRLINLLVDLAFDTSLEWRVR